MSQPTQPEGSHVHWPPGYDEADVDGTEYGESVHRMRGTGRKRSSSWDVRFPNDEYVLNEAVTLEEMRRDGAV